MIKSDWCRYFLLSVWLVGLSLGSSAAAQIADISLPDAPRDGIFAIVDQTDPQSADQTDGQAQGNPTPATTQEATPPAQTPPASQNSDAAQTDRQKAQQQLEQQEKQRVLGIVPNFNTSYVSNAVPLSPKQKLALAFRSSIDPFQFVAAAADAGINQWEDSYPTYGEGAEGYAKYFGASYTDNFDGEMIGNAIFPIILKQDPRYFRKGTGTFKHRLLYSISTTVWCKNDNQKWGPNYSNVLGNIAAGGISNLYYPAAQRGVGLTFERGLTVTAEGTIGGVFDEFWPDIAHKFLKGRYARFQGNIPGASPKVTPAPPAPAPNNPAPATPPPSTQD